MNLHALALSVLPGINSRLTKGRMAAELPISRQQLDASHHGFEIGGVAQIKIAVDLIGSRRIGSGQPHRCGDSRAARPCPP